MKIFGIKFGKKKEEKKEENYDDKNPMSNTRYIRYDIDKSKSFPKDSPGLDDVLDDVVKDSLRMCYKPYSRYKNFVEQIKKEGWYYLENVQTYSMNHLDSNMIRTYYVGQGMYGTFLNVTCPASYYKITICGFDDAGIDPQQFYSHPNLYPIPHFFSITCTDNNGKELSSDITIDVTKVKSNGETKKLCSEFYGDISQHIDGRFRRKEERYYFYESIKLEDTERLSFSTNPDIDIEKTKLFMKADLFAKDII